MSSPGITAINSGPLIIRSYNDITGKNNTYILNQYDYPVSSNYIMTTSTNGLLLPTDRPYISSITASSMNASTIQGSTMATANLTVTNLFTVPMFTAITLEASTFTGVSMNINTLTVNSSMTVSSLNATNIITRSLQFSTISGSTILATTLFVSSLSSINQTFSTLNGSTISTTTAIVDSTLIASTITAINYRFSTMIGSTISAVSTISISVACSTLLTSTLSGIAGPTVRRFTAATYSTITTGTYTPSIGVVRIRVRMCAGGGGGGGYLIYGNNGTSTIFGTGTSQWIAAPGYGAEGGNGVGYNGGNGGSGGTDATALNNTLVVRIPGGKGQGGSLTNSAGGQGGSNTFGGGGAGAGNFAVYPVLPPSTPNGWPGIANTGGGGGGGSAYNTSYTSPGGGAGEYVEFYVSNPGSITYTVGNGGYEGQPLAPIDVCCWFGGYGASGIILIEEFYM